MTLICSRAVATLRCSTVSFAIRPTFYFLKILSGDGPIATILGYIIFFQTKGSVQHITIRWILLSYFLVAFVLDEFSPA